MSTRAFCLASVAVLLCLNLVNGWMESGNILPTREPTPMPSWRLSGRVNAAIENPRTFSGRSANGEELVIDGEDLVLTMTQYRRLHEGSKGRSAGRTAAKPWKNGVIPYEIESNTFTQDQLNWIYKSMKNWESVTCVQFREAREEDTDRVHLTKDVGCYATLGMAGGSQNCSLVDRCFYRGAIEHELGHTMGLIHEHQRENRDDYVKINYFALNNNGIFQINKYAKGSDDKHGLPYDYYSVMHYDKTAFASRDSGKQSIYPRMMNKTDVIGMVMGPSFYDIKLINLMYNCKDRCRYPPVCQEPCFVNENCKCFCENDVPKEHCKDNYQNCASRARKGECESDIFDMQHNCRKTCGVCISENNVPQLPCADTEGYGCSAKSCNDFKRSRDCKKTCGLCEDNSIQPLCVDTAPGCRQKADEGQCESNLETMLKECRRSCDFCLDERLPPRSCEDEDTMCVFLQSRGACNNYKAKMSQFCKRSCKNCDGSIVVQANCVDRYPYCFGIAWGGTCKKYSKSCMISCNQCTVSSPDGTTEPISGGACQFPDPSFCNVLTDNECALEFMAEKCRKRCNRC